MLGLKTLEINWGKVNSNFRNSKEPLEIRVFCAWEIIKITQMVFKNWKRI